MESLDSGKPIRDCETVDVPETIHCLPLACRADRQDLRPGRARRDDPLALVVREPVGVVGLRAAVELPAADARLEDRAGARRRLLGGREAGRGDAADRAARRRAGAGGRACRAGVFNVVPAAGRSGEPLGLHMDVDMVSFTGSTDDRAALPALRGGLEPQEGRARDAAARTRRWCWTMPRTWTSSPSRSSTAPSGTWARTARPPRG